MTTEQQTSLDELEKSLWETADSLRNESSLTSQMYYMPVLGVIFLRHATYRFRLIEKVPVDREEAEGVEELAVSEWSAAAGAGGRLHQGVRHVRAGECEV